MGAMEEGIHGGLSIVELVDFPVNVAQRPFEFTSAFMEKRQEFF